ncbi:hypothetical protein SAMN02745134_00814 [Clostridium acidisoli DSM 12555]|uniref:Uncharacterized protein n=1 Tax=Clostridium acidisoli DSM 12555 TaxID=1121291 RepID=A0A1W1X5X8_9CLOT|nr:hypothetical protein [Clostridium acidisoli]SMC19369.1 hypothetical protein SAMN02745134_00814 [Clostridium acidisoli DSM 12555]
MDKIIDIEKRYSKELEDIRYILQNLENGRYYENTNVRMDGYLSTNITKLKEELNDLLNKIEYNKESEHEKLAEAIKDIQL